MSITAHLLDGVRLLDRVQKGARVRRVPWQLCKNAYDEIVNKEKGSYIGIDGGAVPTGNYPNSKTTLVLIAKKHTGEILMGAQRCEPLIDSRLPEPFLIKDMDQLNRGLWHRLGGFFVGDWTLYPVAQDSHKVLIRGAQ